MSLGGALRGGEEGVKISEGGGGAMSIWGVIQLSLRLTSWLRKEGNRPGGRDRGGKNIAMPPSPETDLV